MYPIVTGTGGFTGQEYLRDEWCLPVVIMIIVSVERYGMNA